MKNRALRRGAGVAALYALLAAVLLAGSTFAWFTFRAYTNVTPLAGTIGTGEGDLLISARRDRGDFRALCAFERGGGEHGHYKAAVGKAACDQHG